MASASTKNDTEIHMEDNIALVGDVNGNAIINIFEFVTKVEGYVEKVFNLFDLNGDGFLDEDENGDLMKKFSLKLFLDTFKEIFAILDINQDDTLLLKEIIPALFPHRNNDRQSPLDLLYHINQEYYKDKNETISLDEAITFIKETFDMIDQNEDCFINLDEVITTLRHAFAYLPKRFEDRVKQLGEYYSTMANFVLRQFVTAADADGDKKTTLAEIEDFKDLSVMETLINGAVSMGEPNKATAEFLFGQGSGVSMHEKEAVFEIWLNVLYQFMMRKYFHHTGQKTDCGL